MSISNGVLANAANFNAAFESKNKTVVSKTANYTATTDDFLINCDATSAAFTITLPAAASNSGKIYEIYKTDSSTNAVTIDANSSETISGFTTKVLGHQYHGVLIICDGSGWVIQSEFKGGMLTYAKSADYTVLAYDDFIRTDNTGGDLTFTLPALSAVPNGKKFYFRRGSGALGNVTTITRAGSDVIASTNGTTVNSVIIATAGETLELTNVAGSFWAVTHRGTYGSLQSYTPTVATVSGTMTNYTATANWCRIGEWMKVVFKIAFTGAAGTWSAPTVSLPSGVTINNTNLLNGPNGYRLLGHASCEDSGVQNYPCIVHYYNTTSVTIGSPNSSGTYLTNTGLTQAIPFSFASGDSIIGEFMVPITDWEG